MLNCAAVTNIYQKFVTYTIALGISSLFYLFLAKYPAKAETDVFRIGTEVKEASAIGQITNVNQLSDVQPTDWAY